MDRLLVATDFSPRSDRALRRASLIARNVGAALSLIHVVDADQPNALIEPERAAADDLLAALAATIRGSDGIEANWSIVVNDVHAGILSAAEELKSDLIVIGPHRDRLRDVFVGTTAERLVRHSTCPLLVAVGSPVGPYRTTLLALDFDEASKSAGRAALDMGIFDHTQVVIMHAFDAPGESMMKRSMEHPETIDHYVGKVSAAAAQTLQALLAELGLPPASQNVVSIKGTPARTILESAREAEADLIVLGTNQRKGFERILVGSVTADVIRDAHRDVLIIPVDEEI